jgi:methyl-accepting chemotaxis protein
VDVIRDMNTQIATAAEEQHQVAEDINRHISQIHGDAQLVAELANSARLDSQSLAGLSNELDGLVQHGFVPEPQKPSLHRIGLPAKA